MKSFWLAAKFRICQGIYFAITAIILVITVFKLDTGVRADLRITITSGVLLLLLLVFLNFLYTTNLSKILCSVPATGTLLDETPFYLGSGDHTSYRNSFMSLLEIEYTYRGKTRKRRILRSELGDLRVDDPVDIRVCRLLPRIIYVKGLG